MSEDYLIRNCAPTLAGLKTASLFSCPCSCRASLLQSVRELNDLLRRKGLRLLPLRFGHGNALLYLYRPARLERDLSEDIAARLLDFCGYRTDNCGSSLKDLARKLRAHENFPHEIGLFLGYPPEDVEGFIQNHAENYKYAGCWKVYGDVSSAQHKFRQYKLCAHIYKDLWREGLPLISLTVAE